MEAHEVSTNPWNCPTQAGRDDVSRPRNEKRKPADLQAISKFMCSCQQLQVFSPPLTTFDFATITQLHPQRRILGKVIPLAPLWKSRVCHKLASPRVGTPEFVHQPDSKATLA